MEFTKLFTIIGISLLASIAILWWSSSLATSYGYTDVGSNFTPRINAIQATMNATFTNISVQAGNASTTSTSSASIITSSAQLVYRGALILGSIPSMLGLVPDMVNYGAWILDIPPVYVSIASAIIIFSIAMLLAYIFVLGGKLGGR